MKKIIYFSVLFFNIFSYANLKTDLMLKLRNDERRWISVDLRNHADVALTGFSSSTSKSRKDDINLFKTISKDIDLKYLMFVQHDPKTLIAGVSNSFVEGFFLDWFRDAQIKASVIERSSAEVLFEWICMKPGMGMHGISRFILNLDRWISYTVFERNDLFSDNSNEETLNFLRSLD